MKAIGTFMRKLFAVRAAEEKQILASRTPYRQKFFTSDCDWDSRAGMLKMIETEAIVSIEGSDSEPIVITSSDRLLSSAKFQAHRRRYHLKAAGDSWLIWLVQEECLMCHGKGDGSCLLCKGKHWI